MDGSAAGRELAAHAGRYRAQLLKYAKTRLRNPAQAEDAVQDALLAAVENAGRYAGDSTLGTWLTGILKHKIVDHVRASTRDATVELHAEELVAEGAGPEARAASGRALERVERRLAALPRRTSEVFVMRDVIGMSTAETCGELAISTANCAVLLHRARRRLREALAADGLGVAA